MHPRSKRYLGIALVITFAWACSEFEPPESGEFPVSLGVLGDSAYLVTRFRNNEPDAKKIQARLFALDSNGNVSALAHLPLPLSSNWQPMQAMVTDADGKPIVFGITAPDGKNTQAFAFGPGVSGATTDLGFRGFGTFALGHTQRGPGRAWIFYREQLSMNADDKGAFRGAPLLEFEGNQAVALADNVLWAKCTIHDCQQLRLDEFRLRLYANPISDDAYLHEVTSVELPYNQSGSPQVRYGSCDTKAYGTIFYSSFGTFALSATSPSLRMLTDATDQWIAIDSDCPKRLDEYDRFQTIESLFPTGERLEIREVLAGSIEDPNCNPYLRIDKCRIIFDVFATEVMLSDKTGKLVKSFLLHDL